MPYHISRNKSIAECKAQPGNCPLGQDTKQHISKFSLERILKNEPLTDREKDICLSLKTGDLALDYTVPGRVADPTIKRLARPKSNRQQQAVPHVYTNEESGIRALFTPGSKFTMAGQPFEVIACDKPQVAGGEPKTDIFVAARNMTDNSLQEIKISYKMKNAEFGANKLTEEQAANLLGPDYAQTLQKAAETLKLRQRTVYNAGNDTYTLGYRLDVMLPTKTHPTRNNPSYAPIKLDETALMKIYSGRDFIGTKEDAYVANYNSNVAVKGSGVAEYIAFEDDYASPQDVIDKMIPISEYVRQQPKAFLALKAVNYRMAEHKAGRREPWDGNRPLVFAVRWSLDESNQLQGAVNTDKVFDHGASFYGAEFKHLLQRSGRA